jgi:hypothetical protein
VLDAACAFGHHSWRVAGAAHAPGGLYPLTYATVGLIALKLIYDGLVDLLVG